MWSGIIEAVSAPFTQWVKNHGAIKEAKQKRKLAIIDNQARLALSEAQYNNAWEMESLKGNSQYLRVFCFVQFAIPLMISVIYPEHGAKIWANLEMVPAWFVKVYIIMVGSIWGIHEFKQVAPSIIGEIGKRFRSDKKG